MYLLRTSFYSCWHTQLYLCTLIHQFLESLRPVIRLTEVGCRMSETSRQTHVEAPKCS